MISLLYLIQLQLICIPMFPSSIIVSVPLMLAAFKIEGWVLHHFQAKPKKTWAAKKMSLTNVKYFIASIMLGAVISHLIMFSTTHSKMCHVQLESFPYVEDNRVETVVRSCIDSVCVLLQR